MTNILAMDTSGPSLSVALVRDGRLIYECTQQNGLTHSDSLMPLVDNAFEVARLTPGDVHCFAVTKGPGSFTGVRIGVATAKALAHATGASCYGVNALEALARGATGAAEIICSLQDARAGQVYCAAYRDSHPVLPDAAMKLADLLALLSSMGRCCFVGDGATAYREDILAAMGPAAVFASAADNVLRAANAALIAAERQDDWQEWQALRPYYLRAPQAERERQAREAKHG